MDISDPDSPSKGRLGSILLNKWDYMAKKDKKMKFIPKIIKTQNNGGRDLLDVDVKKEEQPLLIEPEAKMILDDDQVEDKDVEVKSEESRDDNYRGPILMESSLSSMRSQGRREVFRREMELEEEKEFSESDEEGVFKINMEKLNKLTNKDVNNMMYPVSLLYMECKEGIMNFEERELDKLLKEQDKNEDQRVLNDKSNGEFKSIENDSLRFEIEKNVSKTTSSYPINKKMKKKYSKSMSVEEEREKEKLLDDFKVFTHYFIDKLSGDMKNSNELLFFQFPPVLPVLLKTQNTKDEIPEIKIENKDNMNIDSEQNIPHKTTSLDYTVSDHDKLSGMFSLPDSEEFNTFKQYLPDGCVGQLKIRKSGKTVILWEGIEMNVTLGSDFEFLQDIVALDYKNNKKAWLMGRTKQKFIVTPDIEKLLE
ncbi:hypothetical protein T552_00860 [Pneumocystis carinii B80]|uniref:DNA-directed RNA polymerase III subunit RPC4 n=1 Tax=Pneumocystis carinii (strain B80) TaxID=1408658 RepID=A0A0W4ZMQ1_PNEC8|nr:hypothetical protein T552_00860 [Pneumocystis carinii B80]KTW29652.1 hypothetical protein T552_00860 [Pneumocystis carinii B80]